MTTSTAVEDYIIKAVQRAEFQRLEDGSCVALVPELPGLVALGMDGQACLLDLWRRLGEWVQTSFDESLELPILDGIDLNRGEERDGLVEYCRRAQPGRKRRIFYSDDELFEALDRQP